MKGNFTPRIKHIPQLDLLGEWVLNTQPTSRVSSRCISKVEDGVNWRIRLKSEMINRQHQRFLNKLNIIFMDWAAIYSCGYASRIRVNRCWIAKMLDMQFLASLETIWLMQWKRGLKEFYTKNDGCLCSISRNETRFELASACKPTGTTAHTGL